MTFAANIRAGSAYVELLTRDAKLARGLARAQRMLRNFGAQAQAIGRTVAAAGAAAAVGGGLAVRTFAAFDDRMRSVRAVSGATAREFAALTAEAKRLGAETSFTASQVADSMIELARAGFAPGEILKSIEQVLALSRATDTELARATEIAGAALRGFNLEAGEMGRVADVLTAGANRSAQTLEDLFEALKPVAPIAAEAGESIEDTTAAIGVLANNGIKGSLAGNALARAYKNLATAATQSELAKIGVDAIDAAGNLRPLADIINDIGAATEGMGTGARLSIFETLFGRGQAAALKLASSGRVWEGLREEITNSAGLARKTALEMDAGIGGAFRRLGSAVEGAAIAFGEALADPLSIAAELLGEAAGWANRFVSTNPELARGLALVAVGAIAAGAALAVFGFGATVIAGGIGAILSVATLAGTAVGVLGSAIAAIVSPLGLATAAVIGLGVAAVYYSGAGGAALRWLAERFGELAGSAGEAVEAIVAALQRGDVLAAAGVLWAGLKVAWLEGTGGLANVFRVAWGELLKTFNSLWFGAVVGLEMGLAAIETAWSATVTFLANTWDRFTTKAGSLWDAFVTGIAKGALDVRAAVDDDFSREDAAEGKAYLDRARDDNRESAEDAMQDRIDERTRRRDEEHRKRQAGLSRFLGEADRKQREANEKIDGRTFERINEAEDKLAKARKELEDAIAKAAGEAGGDAIGDGDDPGTIAGSVGEIVGRIREALSPGGLSSKGTFSAAAAGDLGFRSLDRLVEISEETAENTRRTARNTENAGLAFG